MDDFGNLDPTGFLTELKCFLFNIYDEMFILFIHRFSVPSQDSDPSQTLPILPFC